MKMSRTVVWIIGGAALMAGLIVFGLWHLRLYSESEMRLKRAMLLEAHDQFLLAEVAAGVLKIEELKESLRVASIRMNEAERLLEMEKKTHDPIRRQIEEMLAEKIGYKDNLSRRDKSNAALNESLQEARNACNELSDQVAGQRDQIAKLEMELKSAREREDAVQLQLVEVRNSAAELKAKLDEAERHLSESAVRDGELQRQNKAVDPSMVTNAASTASSP
jgi:chromosome segregation ATPase